MFKKFVYSLIFIFLFVSCSPQVEYAAPAEVPEIWQVFLSPTLDGVQEDLQTCLAETNVKIVLEEGYHYQEGKDYSLVLLWGDSDVSNDAFVLLQDTLNVVVNKDNPLQEISISELADIYSGNVNTWEEVNSGLADLGEVELWVYPPGVDIEKKQSEIVLPFEEVRPDASIAPNAAVMLETVQGHKNAVGLLPGIWMDDSVKQIKILELGDSPEIPVIMIIPAEIREKYSGILSCFEDKLK